MITGKIALQKFQATVANAKAKTISVAEVLGEEVPLKILAFQDLDSELEVHLVFSPQAFEAFVDQVTQASNRVVRIRTPDAFREFFSRNGKPKG